MAEVAGEQGNGADSEEKEGTKGTEVVLKPEGGVR